MFDKRITEGNEDPYIILRVRRDARPLEIRKAYASLALKLHPDLFYGQEAKYKSAEEKFKTINWAYDVLADPFMREAWDRAHPQLGYQFKKDDFKYRDIGINNQQLFDTIRAIYNTYRILWRIKSPADRENEQNSRKKFFESEKGKEYLRARIYSDYSNIVNLIKQDKIQIYDDGLVRLSRGGLEYRSKDIGIEYREIYEVYAYIKRDEKIVVKEEKKGSINQPPYEETNIKKSLFDLLKGIFNK